MPLYHYFNAIAEMNDIKNCYFKQTLPNLLYVSNYLNIRVYKKTMKNSK
jgi:hypothetical protein